MNYYSRHIGDYIRDTSHLTLLEHGIYTRLLDVYYTQEGPLDSRGIARLIGIRTEPEAQLVLVILEEFFIEKDGRWSQPRCDREIAAYKAKAERNREVGKLGGRPKKHQEEPTDNPDGSVAEPNTKPPKNQEPIANKEKRTARKRATPLPDDFKLSVRIEAWMAEKGYHPADVAAQTEAFVSYAKRKGATYVDWDEALMTAIREDWAKYRVPKPQDVARTTVPPDPRNDFKPDPRMTPEERAASDRARKLVIGAFHNITPRAA